MLPLFLVPIGLFALVTAVGSEVAFDSIKKASSSSEQEVTLKESITSSPETEDRTQTGPNLSAIPTSAGFANPIVKAATEKALKMEIEARKQRLAQNTARTIISEAFEENPGKHFPQNDFDGDDGYSAPLGLKDESHNDWAK